METFYLVIDESGAKGYADQTESKPGEFGVMTGFHSGDDRSMANHCLPPLA